MTLEAGSREALGIGGERLSVGKKTRLTAFAAAAALFAVGAAVSARHLGLSFRQVRWAYVVAVGVFGFPGTFCLNALELCRVGAALGAPFRFFEAVKVVLIGAAANLLPLPGAAITRVAALRAKGVPVPKGSALVIGLFCLWAGLASALLGLGLAARELPEWGMVGVLACPVLLAVGSVLLVRTGVAPRNLPLLLLIRTGALLVDVGRFWACLRAVGVASDLSQAAVLVASQIVGSAVGFAPGGLGIQESGAAALALAAGLPASAGFLAAGVNRLINSVLLGPWMVAAWRRDAERHDAMAAG
ncbi:lysylphosphatidylglycerol synthase domain-containing protein [Deferrisoma sp.]